MKYEVSNNRYDEMNYRRCGNAGIKLPAISLGLSHNFGIGDSFDNCKSMICKSFDLGITHFDIANTYGPPHGSAEQILGKILKMDLHGHRDELVISTKAGFNMWQGPYGNGCSKKHLISSLDQSLKRLGLDYVDIFYLHRKDNETEIDEVVESVGQILKTGKALYIGISNYNSNYSKQIIRAFEENNIKCILHQHPYSLFNRRAENKVHTFLKEKKIGAIAYMPLAQGLLTNRYINDIPKGSRAMGKSGTLNVDNITIKERKIIRNLNEFAAIRGQSLSQMALSWVLHNKVITSAIIGASCEEQIIENVKCLNNIHFTEDELTQIYAIINS